MLTTPTELFVGVTEVELVVVEVGVAAWAAVVEGVETEGVVVLADAGVEEETGVEVEVVMEEEAVLDGLLIAEDDEGDEEETEVALGAEDVEEVEAAAVVVVLVVTGTVDEELPGVSKTIAPYAPPTISAITNTETPIRVEFFIFPTLQKVDIRFIGGIIRDGIVFLYE
jgi:hypothetical protein